FRCLFGFWLIKCINRWSLSSLYYLVKTGCIICFLVFLRIIGLWSIRDKSINYLIETFVFICHSIILLLSPEPEVFSKHLSQPLKQDLLDVSERYNLYKDP